eukprot:1194369-Prorocentrum_minimum.AAC.5
MRKWVDRFVERISKSLLMLLRLVVLQVVRIHWTGCPNTCGQVQVADLGFLGTTAKGPNGPEPAVDVFMGGTIGHDSELANCVKKAVSTPHLTVTLTPLQNVRYSALALRSTRHIRLAFAPCSIRHPLRTRSVHALGVRSIFAE